MPFEVAVVTPEEQVTLAGDCALLIARGLEGDVGVMAGHTPLLVGLSLGPLTIVHEDDRRTVLVVDGGFLDVHENTVTVLAEYAVNPSDRDRADVEREVEELRGRLEAEPESQAIRDQLARATLIQRLL